MAELKECPFCGWKKARIISRYSPGGRRIRYIDKFQLQTHERKYYVRCNRCFAHGGYEINEALTWVRDEFIDHEHTIIEAEEGNT